MATVEMQPSSDLLYTPVLFIPSFVSSCKEVQYLVQRNLIKIVRFHEVFTQVTIRGIIEK
jgi:hypothetical protein